MRLRGLLVGLTLLLIVGGAVCFGFLQTGRGRAVVEMAIGKFRGGYTIEDRIANLGPVVESRLRPLFETVGLAYPPHEVSFVAFKDTKVLEVYGREDSASQWRFVKDYPVLGLSGRTGPKLAEGDRQVPEGIYTADYLNANSRYHVSIRLDYPNEDDRKHAEQDGRKDLGGDIMIHGGTASIGCLAMGDAAAEDLFVLAALTTKERTQIIVSPTDFKQTAVATETNSPAWLAELYQTVAGELNQFPQPN